MEKKTIFSDGVVPGITSGNETQYSRISIDGLKKVLGGREMKNVTRGSHGWCEVRCKGTTYVIFCNGLSDCIDWCYTLCGDGGWMTTCY